jgi:transcriptional regulator with XRE-family HTH domain
MESAASRASYIRAKLNVLIPAQLRSLRLKRDLKQSDLAEEAGMKQSRISAMERPGAVNFNIETLVRTAAALKVGLEVKFVPFSEMLSWENTFNQDLFDVIPIDRDTRFLLGDNAASREAMLFGNPNVLAGRQLHYISPTLENKEAWEVILAVTGPPSMVTVTGYAGNMNALWLEAPQPSDLVVGVPIKNRI